MKKVFFVFVVLATTLSCTDYLKETAQQRIPFQSDGVPGDIMTINEIKELALNLPLLYSDKPETKSGKEQKRIGNITSLKNTRWKGEQKKKGTTDMTDYIYIVNYENEEGFCVVSSNNAIEQVMAYSDYGNLSDTTSFPGIHIFMEELGDMVASYGHPCNFYVDTGDTTYFYQYYRTRFEYPVILNIGVSSYARWGQNSPYNTVCSQAMGFTCKTGCVATAIGQIMSYHRYPEQVLSYPGNQALSLNWNSYPASFTQNDDYLAVSTLLYRIGQSVQMEYGYNSSGAYSSEVPQALQVFGYTSSPYQDYDHEAIINSLSLGWPVYIRGVSSQHGGHAWIIESGHQTSSVTYHDYKVYDQYGGYHGIYSEEAESWARNVMWYYNWGWNGDYNGYFIANTYNIGWGNFDTDNKIIPNIRPVSE